MEKRACSIIPPKTLECHCLCLHLSFREWRHSERSEESCAARLETGSGAAARKILPPAEAGLRMTLTRMSTKPMPFYVGDRLPGTARNRSSSLSFVFSSRPMGCGEHLAGPVTYPC